MSSRILIPTIAGFLFTLPVDAQVFSADAEPNGHFINAQPITLGTAFEGQLNIITGDGIDLYSFVLPDDGVLLLEVECEHDSAAIDELDIRGFALEDSAEIMVPVAVATLGANNVPLLTNTQISCMKAGQHYLRVSQVESGGGTQPISYRITATHRPMAFANDAEPNNTLIDAIPLAAGAWAEGRLSVEWPHTDPADQFDYYMIHKTTTGPLILYTELAAEYENVPVEPGNFHVHNADMTISSDADGYVLMGSQGAPLADTAVYTSIVDTGLFYVQLLNPLGYGYCYRFSFDEGPVGMAEMNSSTPLLIHPNPTDGPVTVTGLGLLHLEVLDPGGRSVRVIHLQGQDRISFGLGDLSPGAYLLRTTRRDGTQQVGRLLLTR